MNNKLTKLQVYLQNLTDRKTAPTPEKHRNHSREYHQFLDNEIKTVKSQIESLRLESK